MGQRSARLAALQSWEGAQRELRSSEEQRQDALSTDRQLLGYLGTPEQVSGTGAFGDGAAGGDVLPYTQRYEYDTPYMSYLVQPFYSRTWQDVDRVRDQANALMSEAEQAARAGNLQEAEALRAQADQALRDFGGRYDMGRTYAGFRLGNSPTAVAQFEARSPTARLVGRYLQEGREMLDYGPAYEKAYGKLTEPGLEEIESGRQLAERQVTAGYRQARREAMDSSLMFGGARAPYVETAIAARTAEAAGRSMVDVSLQAAQQRSQLKAQASNFLQTYRDQVTKDSVSLALNYVNHRPGSSASPALAAMDAINLQQSTFYQEVGAAHFARFQRMEMDETARRMMYTRMAIVLGATVLGAGIGGIAAGAVAGGMTAIEGAMAGAQMGAYGGAAATGGRPEAPTLHGGAG